MKVDWDLVRHRIKSNMTLNGPGAAVLKEAKLIGVTETGLGNVARISLASRLSASMLERLLLPDLKKAFEDHTGRSTQFEIEVESKQECFDLGALIPDLAEPTPTPGTEKPSAPIPTYRFRDRLTLDMALSLSTFVETPENMLALYAATEYSNASTIKVPSLILHGPSGVGKTHLLHGAGINARAHTPNLRVKVVTGDEFISDFQASIQKRNMGDFRRRYRFECDFLLIDDLHSLCRAKSTQEELFNLMNHIANTGRMLMITSDRPIQALDGLEDRIKSRLMGGLVIPVNHPSVESRAVILQKKLTEAGIKAPLELITEMAQKSGTCVRSLEGMVNTFAMLDRAGQLNRKMLVGLVGNMEPVPVKLTATEIMTEVAVKHGLTIDHLRGKSRTRVHVNARRESMKRLKEELCISISEIGRLHLRDHSTVAAALKRK